MGFLTQPAAAQNVAIGLKAGLNYSNVTGYVDGISRLPGLAAGVFARVPLSSDGSLLFQPELLYSAKGSRVTYYTGTYTNRSHYIDVPLLAKLTTHGFFAELGPQISFLLADRYETPNGSYTSGDDSYRFALGAAGGIGYQLPQGLGLTLRYSHDVTRLYRQGPVTAYFSYRLAGC